MKSMSVFGIFLPFSRVITLLFLCSILISILLLCQIVSAEAIVLHTIGITIPLHSQITVSSGAMNIIVLNATIITILLLDAINIIVLHAIDYKVFVQLVRPYVRNAQRNLYENIMTPFIV